LSSLYLPISFLSQLFWLLIRFSFTSTASPEPDAQAMPDRKPQLDNGSTVRQPIAGTSTEPIELDSDSDEDKAISALKVRFASTFLLLLSLFPFNPSRLSSSSIVLIRSPLSSRDL
jgi:hypothetical protein